MTITYSDLADRIAESTGMSREAVTGALDTYISQLEELDSTTIDPEAISDEDASFLQGAIASAMRAGDLGHRELGELEDYMPSVRVAEDAHKVALVERDRLIKAARAAGARQVEISRSTGLSVAMIRRITNG